MITFPATVEVPLRMDEHGTIRVGGTRVTLEVVVGQIKQGRTPEQIVHSFDTLTLSDVHMVKAYYLQNREAVEQYVRQQEEEAQENLRRMKAEHPEIFTPPARIKALIEEKRKQEQE